MNTILDREKRAKAWKRKSIPNGKRTKDAYGLAEDTVPMKDGR
jgi:hypothetical protein